MPTGGAMMNPMMMKQQMMMNMMEMGKGKGIGKGKGKKGLKSVPPSQLVWIGNMPQGCDWKTLQEHFNQAGKTKWVEAFEGKGKGTGGVAYSSDAEAQNAIAMLNGSVLSGKMIQVDVWEKMQK